MNRYAALLLAVLLVVSMGAFSACSGSSDEEDNSKNGETSAALSSEEPSSEDKEEEDGSSESSEDQFGTIEDLGELSRYIALGQYDGIQMGEKAVLTDDILETVLNMNYLSDYAEERDVGTERPAAMNDTVVIDFAGYYADSGKEIEGSSSEDQSVILGSGTFIDGFEEAIVGNYAGDTFQVMLTYPEDYYYDDYAGVEARFEITIDAVKETVYPEPSEEIATELGYDSLEVMMEAVTEEAEQNVYNQNVSDVWEAVLEGSTVVEYPEELVKEYQDQYSNYYTEYYEYYATAAGVELEEYISVVFDMTLEAFNEDLNKTALEYAQTTVKEELVMYAILDAEFGREISDEEYAAMLTEKAAEFGMTEEELESNYGQDTLRINMYWDKVMIYVYENAVFGTVTE